MSAETLYIIGLVLVLLYVSTGVDDFIWDIICLWKRGKQKNDTLSFKDLEEFPPKLIALVIAAWHEDNVLLNVVENIIASQQYPKSMYHIFLGVYPNDSATVYIAQQLQKKFTNVHCVINYKEGPTSKAQNINYVISRIKDYEKGKDWRFSAVTVHDSEDLVHPYEFKVTNYLMNKYPAIQFPVFPLIKKPTFRNFFSNITTNTYADEFAENHFITMVSRRNTGAFVPSAGTGFSLARDTIDTLGYHVLPENSLTEDYRLSLTLYENGLQMHYVLEKLERLDFQGEVQTEYIATRSMFPNTFKTAVKQKTRWTLGITMQSLKFKEIFNNELSFAGKYSLYRDQKAKIGNLLSMVGYPVLIYFIVSLFIPLTPIYPKYTLSWYLCAVVTVMMIERQIFRAVALKNIYGFRSVFFGCLFPPVVPIRIVWGNIINLVATVRAYIQFIKGKRKNKDVIPELNLTQVSIEESCANTPENLQEPQGEEKEMMKFEWSKTEHSFLDKEVLSRFHRRFGDVLVAKGYITTSLLKELLDKKDEEVFVGEYLLGLNVITEKNFIDALTSVKNIPFVHKHSLSLYDLPSFRNDFDKRFLLENKVLPLLKTKDGYVFAYGSSTPINTQALLRKKFNVDKQTVLTLDEGIIDGISKIYNGRRRMKENVFDDYLLEEKITVEQLVIIRNYVAMNKGLEEDIANQMGVCQNVQEQNYIIA
ncbi:glycosyltransferase [Anaerotignum sp. MB30-C6]|uniref:glycosyltransferase n=1 Tax=Anaerotignum sp. MB30-C6 TaxID=3070814 RepID=UPI0027DD02F8|nr:glycosyltransferase [Anaerotignum sp. MB30-C6]WMI79804.1 glycosyltransferase [Anaerotignum sp. MB30-C6]